MSLASSEWHRLGAPLYRLLSVGVWLAVSTALADQNIHNVQLPSATNLLQFRQLALTQPGLTHQFRLVGQVGWVSPSHRTLALMDATGGLILELNSLPESVHIGQLMQLTGAGSVIERGDIFKIGVDGLIVDNDGLHATNEICGTVFLQAGSVPIRLQWFNGAGLFALEASYEGPDLPRRRIDGSVLFRTPEQTPDSPRGLDYECYEGWWMMLPDFGKLKPVKTGTVRDFDLGVRSRDEGVGLQFTGFLRVPEAGLYKFYLNSDDGSRMFIGSTNLHAEIISHAELPPPHRIFVGQILPEDQDGSWCQVEGQVSKIWTNEDGLRAELAVGQAHMDLQFQDATDASNLVNHLIRATGFCQGAFGSDGLKVPNLLLVPDHCLEFITSSPPSAAHANAPPLPLLTTISAVHQLKREEAQSGRSARVRGVITATDRSYHGFTLQDSERGVYVQGWTNMVCAGDFVEVEGVTDPGIFSPMLWVRRLTRLGEGRLPEPIRPNWDQLNNGSLDAQYVEIEGIVVSSAPGRVELLTSGGTINVDLNYGLKPESMSIYENMLVRIRGALIASRNDVTHQVLFGRVRIYDPVVTGQTPVLAEIASAREKTPAELLLFDPRATCLERIRMSGQVTHVADDICFMMVSNNGVRFRANHASGLEVGDTVEVAGYPQLGGPSPLLLAAVARKTAHAALPDARALDASELPCAGCDATRVRMEGVLTGIRNMGWEKELDLQNGAQRFVARVVDQKSLLQLPVGCRLELTGTYAMLGGNQGVEYSASLYELLLNSPADIRILARPPWWTLRRLLIMIGMLLAILVLAAVWITQLNRKVEESAIQLEDQIRKRQAIEQQRAMEQERARVAHDLHDELGSGLTEISMLAAIPRNTGESEEPLEQIGDRARSMVAALDEIVWAMNPKHDLVDSLGSYLCLYADQFLRLASIQCHLKGTLDLPSLKLNPIHRHEFFLAFKEALNNIVRHSGATEAQLNIRVIGSRLRVSLTDNGSGLQSTTMTVGMEGLSSMKTRLNRIGGRFAIASKSRRGTIIRFYMPLN